MRVRCINARNYALTVGNIYEVIAEDSGRYSIENNNNVVSRYGTNLFEVVDEATPATPRQRGRRVQEVTTPTPPPVPVRTRFTEQQMVDSIVIRTPTDMIGTTVIEYTYKEFVDSPAVIKSINISLTAISQTALSCGIGILVNVGNFERLATTPTFINFQENDYETLFNGVINALGREIRDTLNEGNRRFYIASDVEQHEITKRVLEAGGFVRTTDNYLRNPNSNNNIAIFQFVSERQV